MVLAVSRAKTDELRVRVPIGSLIRWMHHGRPNQGHAKRGSEAVRVDAARAESDDAIGIGGVADQAGSYPMTRAGRHRSATARPDRGDDQYQEGGKLQQASAHHAFVPFEQG